MRLSRLMLLFAVATAACGGGGSGDSSIIPTNPGNPGTPANPVATTAVTMRNTAFDPAAIVVVPGAVVTFTNDDGINHNATFSSTSITSTGTFSSGSHTVKMPTATGTYGYTCTLHPGMSGTVKVQ